MGASLPPPRRPAPAADCSPLVCSQAIENYALLLQVREMIMALDNRALGDEFKSEMRDMIKDELWKIFGTISIMDDDDQSAFLQGMRPRAHARARALAHTPHAHSPMRTPLRAPTPTRARPRTPSLTRAHPQITRKSATAGSTS